MQGQFLRNEKSLQLAEGNDASANGKMQYNLTTPLVLSTGDKISGVGRTVLSSLEAGTRFVCTTTQNALWDDVYDGIGCVMILNSLGTTIEDVNIWSATHALDIFFSGGGAAASNGLYIKRGVYTTQGTGSNCPAAMRVVGRIYYFEVDDVELLPSTTTDCFATSGHPRGAALMLSRGSGSEWVFKGPIRWTVPAKHEFIQNRMGPTDPDRGINYAGFPQRNTLIFQNMGHFQATAGGGTGVICRCENVSITFNSTPGTADYNVSAGTDAAYIFGSNSYGAIPSIQANEYSFLSVANNAATIAFTNSTPILNLAYSGISTVPAAAIHFQDFPVTVKATFSDATTGIGLCDPRAPNHLVRRSTGATSGNNAITCLGTGGSSTADRREYAHYVQGGMVRQGFHANPADARIWESWTENGTSLNFYRVDPDTPSQRFMQWDTSAVNFYGSDGSTVIQRINKATGQVEFPNAGGTAPFTVTSTTEIANLNAQRWHGKQALDFSGALDFPSIAAQACAELTIAAAGAAVNSPVAPSWPAAIEAGILGNMRVSSAGTVSVRLCNVTASAIDPASQTFAGRIIQ